jgi:ribose/xylose/arabinose/galactoside ABC-type transport system permease subunit
VLFILGRFTSLERLRSLNARLGLQGRPGRLSLGLYKLGAYGLSGLLAAGAGLALLNLLGTFVPGGYGDLTFVAIAAAVIGGALLWRGSTRLIGAPLGALVIVAIRQVVMRLTLLGRRLFGGPLREMLLCALLVLVLAVVWWVADWLLNRAFGRSKQMPAGQ